MKKYILKRLAQMLLVILGVTFLTYLVTWLAPSDPAEMLYLNMGITPTDAQLAATRQEMGLDDPFLVQYFRWLGNLLKGDLGESYSTGESVLAELTRKIPQTLKLAGFTMAAVILVSFPLGLLTAVRRGRFIDYFVRFVSFFGISMPGFWLGLMTMYIFGVVLKLLPVVSRQDFKSMIMPTITLGVPMLCSYTRQLRIAFLEELSSDYITGLRARGISEGKILLCHVLPNAMPPIVTLLGLSVGGLLGGAAIVETIFGWQGIGSMVVTAIRVRDYPVIQAYVLWMAVIYVLVNLLVDLAQYGMNPRLRRTGAISELC